jgi:hypothetical protein
MMRKGLNQVSFSHILREGNSVAGFNILKLCILLPVALSYWFSF